MRHRLPPLTEEEIRIIHRASAQILEKTGVAFPGGQALDIFREHGFKTNGDTVFITEERLMAALNLAPGTVDLVARNAAKNHRLGGEAPFLIGTTGPSQVVESDGRLRLGLLSDHEKVQKLAQTSSLPQGTPYKSIFPSDVPAKTAHLDMLFQSLTLTDGFAGGDAQDSVNTRDTLEMLKLVFGGREGLLQNTVVRVTISVLSPLRYAPEQVASLVMLAENNQLPIISNMAMFGSTAPLNLAQGLALGNAEILAGIVLAQLVRPGAPVVYGSTSCPVEMKGLSATLGSPEALKVARATTALARHYGLPSRTGGGLTDSHRVDGQASGEAALSLKQAMDCGADVLMHAFGMVGAYLGLSLEKWLLDEELAGLILAALKPLDLNGDIDVSEIIELGSEANYLMRPSTTKNYRSLHQFQVFNKLPRASWEKRGSLDSLAAAGEALGKRLERYEKPPIDPKLEAELAEYVKTRKQQITT